SGEKRVFLVILFTSFSGSLVSRISGAVQVVWRFRGPVYISPDARTYQYVGPLYIHTTRGYFKRRAESSKFKYKQRIISLTYVFVPLALKPREY
ncbi:hypothetical protein, partial [Escherichia coli]|uniref:hypothetical protein n=1 Tax=Escherichia coli TaxID=562 RepID=UPI001BC82ED9